MNDVNRMPIDYHPTQGFIRVDVPIYLVIARNRVQMRSHNLELCMRYASQLGCGYVIESEDFTLIKEHVDG